MRSKLTKKNLLVVLAAAPLALSTTALAHAATTHRHPAKHPAPNVSRDRAHLPAGCDKKVTLTEFRRAVRASYRNDSQRPGSRHDLARAARCITSKTSRGIAARYERRVFKQERRRQRLDSRRHLLDSLHPVLASYYALYGNRTACGQTLTPHTLGVANRTLPCGTPVVLEYHGRVLRVPVIDRGPYVYSRYYDMTTGTAEKLGVSISAGVNTVYTNY